ncbi:MAG: glycoside hydrolase family 3 protein [Clostridia bacterium]|nr:glycoside hydrolase family 3 protein [Clostridia bacterium]
MGVRLKDNPFFLNDAQITWVKDTLASMTEKEKIHQLFCLVTYSDDEEYCRYLSETVRPGGVMGRVMTPDKCVNAVSTLQNHSRIPLLIAANLEAGGNGVVSGGTAVCRPMQAAATGDAEFARRLGEVCGAQGSAAGVNWSFAPIIDIDYNWRNPITNFRTFGSDVETVAKMGEAYVKEIQRHGVAACIKHFPGDGCDERDQHVSVSVNSLSCDEWDKTFGKVYSRCIEAGAMSVMVGHIMQPAYTGMLEPDTPDADMLPASVNRALVTGLLRERLGFNGVIVTDSSAMAGISLVMPRESMIPMTIASGCDMFLFTKNLEEDIYFMEKGYENGVFTRERLDEAVTRILAMKAALGLHQKQRNNELCPDVQNLNEAIKQPIYKQWEKECADRAITLVKEEKGVFPITPDRFEKILFCPLDKNGNNADEKTANGKFKRALENAGFKVTLFESQNVTEGNMTSVNELTKRYDMIIYSAMVRARYQPVARIDWSSPQGANIPTLCHTIPTVFVSLENPYHLVDVPQVRTYINCYNGTQAVIDALMEKLMGKSEFTGVSPVDAFCGKWDAAMSFGPKIDFSKYGKRGEK